MFYLHDIQLLSMTKVPASDLLQYFSDFIKKEKLLSPTGKILLAVSGGLDSAVMAELFHRCSYDFSIAHCNFNLRGKESDSDEKFVKALANKYGVRFFLKRFLTESVAKKNKLSIQETARMLRYQWFSAIAIKNNYSFVATAHHLDDNIETFFINLLRGTGISGLAGISPLTDEKIIRPLLFATRKEIESFAKENKLKYREDSSNETDDYLRNKIRHHLVPVLKKINPAFHKTMGRTFRNMLFADHVFNLAIIDKTIRLSHLENGMPYFSRKELQSLEFPEDYLYEFLSPFHFNAAQVREIWESKQPGNVFYSNGFRVTCDRDKIIFSLKPEQDDAIYQIRKNRKTFSHKNFSLTFKTISLKGRSNFRIPSDQSVACLDAPLLRFPLTVRKWQAGDSFFPLGMNHRKKLSDFFIDKKFSLPEKENIFVLLSGEDIVSVLGHRVDNRYKVNDSTEKVLRIDYISKLK
jgi:tRNA(Ile)-lysidine synthase